MTRDSLTAGELLARIGELTLIALSVGSTETEAPRDTAPTREPRPSYHAMWNERRRQREPGPSGTWRRDALWKAACAELRAKETVALIRDVRDHATHRFLERLVAAAEREWARADRHYATFVASIEAAA
jgi:hypothetical protein